MGNELQAIEDRLDHEYFVDFRLQRGNSPVRGLLGRTHTEQTENASMLIIGTRNMEAELWTSELPQSHVGAKPMEDMVANILAAIKERRT